MELVKFLNKYLISHYGLAMDGKPKFRVVFSEDLYEVRKTLHGELAVFETEEKVKKYNYLNSRYVLEVYTLNWPELFGRAIEAKSKIVTALSDGYEPLRVFQNKKREYLRPDMEICKIICDAWSDLTTRPAARRLTAKQASYDDVVKMRAESDKFFELLNANDSELMSQFHDGEAVIIHREQ